ncbi:hypothetical protein J5J86_21280 [Aquabacter sp. L1I39]|uniref:hypothetical protein n=1 Tax=Aquabacter sp. L1I39 TaxID=2820278 RepID=UPI001ADC962C|nr:hypothetical protein [Aquabacter sp. L1I39]QTL03251.1 hypothetical protein J5J86_21280 [Aquabacter sp. L1I39]
MPDLFPRHFLRPRTLTARIAGLALAGCAVAAFGAGVLPRLLPARDAAPHPWASSSPAPAEPGLFEFPSPAPAAPAALAAAPAPEPVPRPSLPVPNVKAVAVRSTLPTPPALPAGVERFDACNPACDSRDPATRTAAPVVNAAAPATSAGTTASLRPPQPLSHQPPPEPNLLDRTVDATRTALASVTDQVKNVIRLPTW